MGEGLGLLLGTAAGVLLVLFTLRRWLFLLTALLPEREAARPVTCHRWPSVLLLVPVHDEGQTLPGCLESVAALTYPQAQLTVVLVDDCSCDNTPSLCRAASAGRINWHTISLKRQVGKAAALQTALARFAEGEIVAVYDADTRPRPDALCRLVTILAANPQVGAVSGRRAVANPLAGPAAAYATFENLVHQFITVRAKDRLGLAPAVLGSNCAYRRTALAQTGGFRPDTLLEDSDLTVRLARAGWRLRFVAGAVSAHAVPTSLRGYWRQHVRWSAGFNAIAESEAHTVLGAHHLPPLLRLELLAFAAGYLDRLALLLLLLSALLLRALGRSLPFIRQLFAVALLTPLAQVVAALLLVRAPVALWSRLPLLPIFFTIDTAATITALIYRIRQQSIIWYGR